ncbi:GNAT family N-acetyltransferase [Roseateles sp. DAIF2]|uniref:GNAT family N-acetyltransferase n=1 Tax=Roseateles sp. DAIF2 TaxID=2714952 RepID=UPI0018A32C8E|nr:GNAT family N-acetyltransferase [Roseateles sp. DAIF2]QPF73632.1 GNAT family N-acetyltransferase [Roseateles sp. DAIF2]
MTKDSSLTIRRLAPELKDDFLRYFEGAAFADNPKWKSCYCQFLYVDHAIVNWSARTAEENRSAACDRIACKRMQGLLAYRDGQVVGWCNAAPRVLLDSFADEPIPDAEQVGQITCFVVAREHRRTGVARALLEEACALLRDQGLLVAEANPSREAVSDAEQHFGPLSLYLSAGFSIVKEQADGLVVVRRPLI